MKRIRIGTALLILALLLSGCGALPDTTLGHKCGTPDGVGCLSTQEVYDRSIAGDLPGLNRIDNGPIAPRQDRGIELPVIAHQQARVLQSNALYAPAEELRIWVNRWRDKDGDLHDDSFIYVLLGEGQWLVRD
jgi:conjugal transfer pilus assembly protein TraV